MWRLVFAIVILFPVSSNAQQISACEATVVQLSAEAAGDAVSALKSPKADKSDEAKGMVMQMVALTMFQAMMLCDEFKARVAAAERVASAARGY